MRNRKIRLALVAGAAAAAMIAAAIPAGAIPDTGPTILTGNENSLAGVGSDTSYWMMSGISPQYNVNTTKNTDGDYVTQVPPVNVAPFPAGAYVPDDAWSPGRTTWTSLTTTGGACGGGTTPPNGSSAGITCLNADTTGQVDFARSSRGPKTGETSTLDFWAYAIGAVDLGEVPGFLRAHQLDPDPAHRHLHVLGDRRMRRSSATGTRSTRRRRSDRSSRSTRRRRARARTASSTRTC